MDFWWESLMPAQIMVALSALTACSFTEPATRSERHSNSSFQLIIGQDLDAFADYTASTCCTEPDGITQYLMFFDLADPARDYGGLGIDLHGSAVVRHADWGGGPTNLREALSIDRLHTVSIGLSLAENEHPGVAPGALTRVAQGEYDLEIDQLARLLATTDKQVLLRIGYEFEGVWNVGYDNHEAYVAAYRHIADRLRAAELGHVAFVWQASTSPIDDIIDEGRDDIALWYPGDRYADWIGISVFLPPDAIAPEGVPPSTPTIAELVEEMITFAETRGKPVIIAEAAPQGFDLSSMTQRCIVSIWDCEAGTQSRPVSADDIWQTWYAPVFQLMQTHPDTIHAFAYINANWDEQGRWSAPYPEGYWGDSRLQANPDLAARWNRALSELRQTADQS